MVGLKELQDYLHGLESDRDMYRWQRVAIPGLLISIEEGNGISYITRQITATLKKNDLRTFTGVADRLEYVLDGSYKQLKNTLADISNSKVYANAFQGVVSINCTALAEYINEPQTDLFLDSLKDIMEDATVLIFLDPSVSLRAQKLHERIREKAPKLTPMSVTRYTTRELAEIVISELQGRYVVLEGYAEGKEDLIEKIEDLVGSFNAKVAHDTNPIVEYLLRKLDYSEQCPVLRLEKLK